MDIVSFISQTCVCRAIFAVYLNNPHVVQLRFLIKHAAMRPGLFATICCRMRGVHLLRLYIFALLAPKSSLRFLPPMWPTMVAAPAPSPPKVRIGPSVLAGDLSMLAKETHRVLRAGADFVHLDVFDGNWVKAGENFRNFHWCIEQTLLTSPKKIV